MEKANWQGVSTEKPRQTKDSKMEGTPVKKEEPEKWIRVYQQKANFFRVVHADGVWCSVSPAKAIHLTFYNERSPLPSEVYFPVKEGVVTSEDPAKRIVKKDWFREMEVDVVLTVQAAKDVRAGLDNFIKITEGLE